MDKANFLILSLFHYISNTTMEAIQTLKNLISLLPFNLFDYIFFVLFCFYVYEEASLGLINALSHLAAIICSFFAGLLLYGYLAQLLSQFLHFSKGISDAVSFFLIATGAYSGASFFLSNLFRRTQVEIPRKLSAIGGAISGAFSFFLIAAFIVSILLSFPLSLFIKSQINNSFSGKILFSKTQNLELSTKQVFGDTIDEALNFLTVKPSSDSTIPLNFKTSKQLIDLDSEKQMITYLNRERKKSGLSNLSLDTQLTNAARAHAKDMLKRGYFSHYTPEGISPFDRLERHSISYTTAAENLAFAPEAGLAFTGLMNSTGHRKNILDSDFHKVGIGVIDAGIYGKMFVQEFTD